MLHRAKHLKLIEMQSMHKPFNWHKFGQVRLQHPVYCPFLATRMLGCNLFSQSRQSCSNIIKPISCRNQYRGPHGVIFSGAHLCLDENFDHLNLHSDGAERRLR